MKDTEQPARIQIALSPAEHKRLKAALALRGMTIQDWGAARVRELVADAYPSEVVLHEGA